MIITRTPFRITLGGGGTDLPSYYNKYGGFIFSFALDKYMYITVKRPFADRLIRLKYRKSETVENPSQLKHDIARECLIKHNIMDSLDVVSLADIPAASGLGSSSSYTVGLLNALHTLNREFIPLKELAEEACDVEINRLGRPMGKQDQYIATFGGFTVLEINTNGDVKVERVKIDRLTIDRLNRNLLLFYTGIQRTNVEILARQSASTKNEEELVLESLHYIKESGYKILELVESGNITELGTMFDEHWKFKKRLAKGISNPHFDNIYEIAKKNGALGGKISGAGGGGFFLFYCENNREKLRQAMIKLGLTELRYGFDYEGTKVLLNLMDYSS